MLYSMYVHACVWCIQHFSSHTIIYIHIHAFVHSVFMALNSHAYKLIKYHWLFFRPPQCPKYHGRQSYKFSSGIPSSKK